MHARRLPLTIEAFNGLGVDIAWLTAYTENQLVRVLPQVLEETDHEYITLCSDDFLVSPEAWAAVRDGLEEGRPYVTGFGHLGEDDDRVNLTRPPLAVNLETRQVEYDWYTEQEVADYPEQMVPTGFGGMTLSGMPRENWERFPFAASPGGYGPPTDGCMSDVALCLRLQDKGLPLVAPKAAKVKHLRASKWPEPDATKPFLIGGVVGHVELRVNGSIKRWCPPL